MRFQAGPTALAVLLLCCALTSTSDAQAVNPRPQGRSNPIVSQNFIVYAADAVLAQKVSREAERYRKTLAVEWLGKELPNWGQKCPITVELGMHAGGETSFAFVPGTSGRDRPIDWQMKIYGPHDRVLDAVLPHEITHTIFATHFGQPLPRWADEGACTTVEHESERKKNHAMLMDFLHAQPSRGLPFNRMFTMRQYPHDILPLYAQGYSVAKFLILQKGKQYFLDYIGKGLHNEKRGHALTGWNSATSEFYEYDDLSDLQLAWLDWVRKGSSETAFVQRGESVNSIAQSEPKLHALDWRANSGPGVTRTLALDTSKIDDQRSTYTSNPGGSWYAQQMQQGKNPRVAAQRQEFSPTKTREIDGPDHLAEGPQNEATLPQEFRPAGGTIWR